MEKVLSERPADGAPWSSSNLFHPAPWVGQSGPKRHAPDASYYAVKRFLDIVLASAGLLLASPILALLALLIKVSDRGPVLHWQVRVGKGGQQFPFPKFRSMTIDAEALRSDVSALNHHGDGVTFKVRNDPRVTRLGQFLRKYSIDEVPQLWCIVRGDMTLVGPRPPLLTEVALYTDAQHERLCVTPGLTCLWQVGGRADLDFSEQVRLDMMYIENQSLALDMKIILQTIPAVLTARGAY